MNAALGWHDGLRVDFEMGATRPASRCGRSSRCPTWPGGDRRRSATLRRHDGAQPSRI